MIDLYIRETGDGGDAVLTGNDFKTTQGFYNFPYFGLFGGNLNGSTDGNRSDTEQSFDWWGNFLLESTSPKVWINSKLESALNRIALTSNNRFKLIEIIKSDLKFMKDFADIDVDVLYRGVDTVIIKIDIFQPSNLQENTFVFIWNSTLNELILGGDLSDETSGLGIALSELLNSEL